MSNNTVINHNTYAEIINGLFFVKEIIFGVSTDDPEEFTFRQKGIQIIPKETIGIINQLEPPQELVSLTIQDIEEAVNHVFRPREQDYRIYIDPSTAQELERFEEDLERHRERNRIENERSWTDIRNMSEEEIIQYFDRISQEEN